MSEKSASSQWFAKFAMVVAMLLVFGLPAIYWACSNLLGMDLRKSMEGAFSRVFSHDGAGGFLEGGPSDDGGD